MFPFIAEPVPIYMGHPPDGKARPPPGPLASVPLCGHITGTMTRAMPVHVSNIDRLPDRRLARIADHLGDLRRRFPPVRRP